MTMKWFKSTEDFYRNLYLSQAEKDGGISQAMEDHITLAGKALLGAFHSLYWLMLREIPHTTNFSSLLDLCEALGCQYLSCLSTGEFSYKSERTVQEFVCCLGMC